jgi:peptide-methionine (S)-S-oxide reductase
MQQKEAIMTRVISTIAATIIILAAAVFFLATNRTQASPSILPAATVDDSLATTSSQQTIVLSGGCFWGIQAVFEHVKGVTTATAGYAGGTANTADYEAVSSGDTGHAESVKVIYDPSKITLGQILRVFFSVAHDPTQLDRQGPDYGKQYRSAIFYTTENQKKIAEAYINQLNQAKVFTSPIVTQLNSNSAFYAAEDYHQDYATKHPNNPYIMFNDAPKVDHLRQQFPDLYKAQ